MVHRTEMRAVPVSDAERYRARAARYRKLADDPATEGDRDALRALADRLESRAAAPDRRSDRVDSVGPMPTAANDGEAA
jgi:hypothetical protein